MRSAHRSTRRSAARRRAADDGRRADLRVDRRPRRRRVEHRRARRRKRQLADELLRRLHARFAPGGLLHHGQGKWYPGEPLPRWAYACYFRKDGEPVWQRPRAVRPGTRSEPADQRRRSAAARRFVTSLANRLGVAEDLPQAAYEDVFYYLWRERRLPVNVDVAREPARRSDRARATARVFERGSARWSGYVLPLRARTCDDLGVWESGRWSLRESRLFLLPGDSPMGYRLPLDALPWESEGERMQIHARDPLAARPPLGPRIQREPIAWTQPGLARRSPSRQGSGTLPGSPIPSNIVRTALCVEPRDGMLHVFMPPVEHLEEYLALVAAVEDGAARARRSPSASRATTPPHRLPAGSSLGHARSRRHRGEHPPARTWTELVRQHDRALRRGAPHPPRHREVHARRAPHRHGRRQPRRDGRRDARRQPVPAPARSAAQPGRLLRQPPVAVVLLLRHVRRPDQPGAAHRRGAAGQHRRAGDRVRRGSAARAPRRRGWSTASSATCWSTSPATPTAPSSASTSSSAPTAPAGARGCSSCARSRCRRTRA